MSDWNGNLILTSVDDDCSSSSHKGKENELPTNKRRSRNSSTETLKSPLKTEVKWERLPAQPALISCVILQNPSVSATQRYSLRSTSAESPVQVGYQRPDIQHSLSPNGRQPRGQKRKAAEMTGGGDADQLADPSPLEDFQVALQLQKLYDLESSYGRVEVRIPGSGNEFNLRNKRGRSSKRSE